MKTLILGSGNGSNAASIITASKQSLLGPTEIVCIISDVSTSGILKVANENDIETQFVEAGSPKHKLSGEFETKWIEIIRKYNPDLIVMAGFMRILERSFLNNFKDIIINIHPSLLPSFKGLQAIEKAFERGVKITGCTIHWVNDEVDGGQIIAQAPVRIMDGDTCEIVRSKVQAAEHMLLPWVIGDLANGNIPFPSS